MTWPQLPKRIHYALKSLTYLARVSGPVRAGDLARDEDIPPAQASKILYLLTWAGFVRSQRGSKGGFWLASPPEEIRVTDVVAFFQPPRSPAERSTNSNDPILQIWEKTSAQTQAAFGPLTLADLMQESPQQSGNGNPTEENQG